MKFYKRSLITAEQFNCTQSMCDHYGITHAHAAYPQRDGSEEEVHTYYLKTLEGVLVISKGDWIATGVNGEHWPIADDIFKKTYAPLPAISLEMYDYITWAKDNGFSLANALIECARAQDTNITHVSQTLGLAILKESEAFARAWLNYPEVEFK